MRTDKGMGRTVYVHERGSEGVGSASAAQNHYCRCQWQSIGGMGVHSALCVHTVSRVDTWASTACVEASP